MKMNKEFYQQSLDLIGRDPEAFSTYFYDRVFEKDDHLQEVFRNTDLRLQKLELVKGFLMIFSLLEDKGKLEHFLHDLGVRHVCYEVRSEHYPIIEEALDETLAHVHGDLWNGELKESWEQLIHFITEKMLEGSRQIKAA